jgi:hypothetical protein
MDDEEEASVRTPAAYLFAGQGEETISDYKMALHLTRQNLIAST